MKGLSPLRRLLVILLVGSTASVLLYFIGVIYYQASIFWFLNWNLALAWLPLIFAIGLVKQLKNKPWSSWQAIVLTLLWLGFLPNSFYIISDLMHLNSIYTNNPLFFAVMIFSFAVNGLLLGFISLYLIHKQLIKRLKGKSAHYWIGLVLLLCSFAVYLGRYLRWSTWDVLLNPAGLIFDVSDRFLNPVAYGQTFQVTIWFFILLGSMYFVLWNLVQVIREDKAH